MVWKRVVSACIFVPFLLVSMYVGGLWWFLIDILLIVLGLKEYRDILRLKDISIPYVAMCVVAVIMVALQSFANGLLSGLALLLGLIALACWLLWKKEPFGNLAFGFAGLLWIAWTLSFLVSLRLLSDGWWLVVLAFLIPWITDTGAYCVGVVWGKHKMAPVISPKKSWEGAIGGTLACLVVLLIYNALALDYAWWFIVCLAIVGSILGQVGDLLESWLKRWVNIKDSGNTIPGHGGILDRFDSMLLVAPVTYYLLFIYHNLYLL